MLNQVAAQIDLQLGLPKNSVNGIMEEWTKFMGVEFKDLTTWYKIPDNYVYVNGQKDLINCLHTPIYRKSSLI